jgi:hypothetical protein
MTTIRLLILAALSLGAANSAPAAADDPVPQCAPCPERK